MYLVIYLLGLDPCYLTLPYGPRRVFRNSLDMVRDSFTYKYRPMNSIHDATPKCSQPEHKP